MEMPALLERYGFKAYTEVGWQLTMPRVIAYVGWDGALKTRAGVARLVGGVASLYENITSRVVRAPELGMYFDRSVEWGLRSFYRGLSMASIRGVKLNISILVPELSKAVNLTVDIGREALANLMQRLPARIVHYRLMG